MVFGRKKRKKGPEDPAVYAARRDYDRAIGIYRDRLAKQPGNLNMRLALADTLLLAERTDDAIQEFRELAGHYTKQGFIVKAVAVYKKILRLRPTMTEIEHYLMELSYTRDPVVPFQSSFQSGKEAPSETKSEPVPFLEVETVLFRQLSSEEFQEVVSRLTLKHYEKGSVIVSEGDPGESMFVIVNGEVRVNTLDAKGKLITLANLGEGEFFGVVSLLSGRPRTATITTNTGTDLLELTRRDYGNIVADHPHVAEVLQEWHHQRAYKTVDALVQAWRESL